MRKALEHAEKSLLASEVITLGRQIAKLSSDRLSLLYSYTFRSQHREVLTYKSTSLLVVDFLMIKKEGKRSLIIL